MKTNARDRISNTLTSVLPLFLALSACGDSGGSSDGGDTETETGPGTATATDSSAQDDTGGLDESTGGDTGDDLEINPYAGGVRRILADQYVNSVAYLLGPEAAAAAEPPDDQAIGGWDSIGAVQISHAPTSIEQYERTARAIATAAISNPGILASHVPCVGEGITAACFEPFARSFGRLAFRRPLSEEEVTQIVAFAQQGQEWGDGDPAVGLRYAITGILQAPSFLYIAEIGEPDPDSGFRKLTPYELASRISFFTVGRTPELALLDHAEDGGLDTPDQIRQVTDELLRRPEARPTLRRFYDELFRLRELPNRGKDPELFPTFTPELAAAMRMETLLIIEDLIWEQNGDVMDMFTATDTFVDANLAAHYGMAAPANDWDRVPIPGDENRMGVLTQAAFLSQFSHPALNSPTRRGTFVQTSLLCATIPPPPPEVDPTLPEPEDPTTLRALLEQHMDNDACRNCHEQVDPIGFAFEGFDPVGLVQLTDNGFPVDTTGELAGLGSFNNAVDLASLLRDDPRPPSCHVRNLMRSALGVIETPDQQDLANALTETFNASDHNMQNLLVELTASPIFTLVDEPR